ncbi:PucR family transcriptional regulator [Streptacidiphilus monticola]|uniref:PucR family transcriptional regulator n=1 Tax=Streptacidiphilus monticola TaxID=2161674 RepID=A0ABW1G9Y3_9ACTN
MAEPRQAAARRRAALGAIPRELAAVMRPELPSLLREMAAEIAGAIPEYGAFINGPEAHVIRLGIEQNIAAFVDQIAMPNSATELRDEICRRFGRFEAYQGRSLDALQDAYRIGCQVALRRAVVVGRRYRLSASVLMAFADALFAYMGEIAELSREGYLQAMAELGEEPDGRRRRLLQRLLSGAGLADGSLAELAEQVGWPLPETVTPVAVHPDSRPERAALGRSVLADLSDPEPHLLVPGPFAGPEEALLTQALADCKAAVGPTVPLAEAGDSLRWARHTLTLTDAPLSYADDHLLTLWLLADQALARQFARRYLGALESYTPTQRRRLLETLHVWLASRGTAAELAAQLGVHPQTFRYRMRVLERVFGKQLTDPDQRFATEVTLRALALQDR